MNIELQDVVTSKPILFRKSMKSTKNSVLQNVGAAHFLETIWNKRNFFLVTLG